MWGWALMGEGSLGPSSNAAGHRGQGQVTPSRCAPFRSGPEKVREGGHTYRVPPWL